jgi:2-polyprenyl-6-methoxyphenol hydroxylase-like FAD-dependent oxidoreductase
MNHFDAEVIIVGGGPVGLMLANELGHRGISTLLLTEKPSTTSHPQANATQARTMEHYRRLGFAEEIRSAGLPADYPTSVVHTTRIIGQELARYEMPSSSEAKKLVKTLSGSWSTPELPHRCSQMYIEPILRRHAEKYPSVSLRFGWRMNSFTEEVDHVSVMATRTTDGYCQRLTARYLVGCDGPRSQVRNGLGIQYAGESGVVREFFGGQMLSMHLRIPDFYRRVPAPWAWMYWVVNPERRGVCIALNGVDEFLIGIQKAAGPRVISEISDAEIRDYVRQLIGLEIPFEIIQWMPWTAGYSLVAESYQQGRVFLAGDAAHLFTPTGGLGYNTGIEDAANLGWKLAAAIQGWGGPLLLDSYTQERKPIGIRNTTLARRYADAIGSIKVPADLEEDSPNGRHSRASLGEVLRGVAAAELNIPGITFGARYDASALIARDGLRPPPDEPNIYVPTALPGGRAPHAWLPDGRSLFDTFGPEFTLLRFGEQAPDARDIVREAGARRIPLLLLEFPDPDRTLRNLYEAALALIRPDQVVAWRGNQPPLDSGLLLAMVSGH